MVRRALAVAMALLLLSIPHGALGAENTTSTGPTSYSVSQISLPRGSAGPSQITSDSSGRIWFVEQGSNQIGSYSPATRSIAEFDIPTPDALPQGIAVDPSGNVWFTELTPNGLGELFPANGSIREYSMPPAPGGLGCGPIGITPQKNGSIWVTCEFSNQIDEFTPSSGLVREFDLPMTFSAPLQVLFDKAGNFWFTAPDAGMLGFATVSQLRPGTSDGIREFAPINSTYVTDIINPLFPSGQVKSSLAAPSQIAFSPDQRCLWVSEHGGGSFDRYGITSGTLTKYFTSVPSSSVYAQSLPNGIAVDASGNVWLAEHYGNRIAEFLPSSGTMMEYPVSCCGSQIAGALYLTTGTNGTIWFTENFGNAIGVLSPVEGPSPVVVRPTPDSVSLDTSGRATISLMVTPGAGNSDSLVFRIAGVSREGNLKNLTATFTPSSLTLDGAEVTASLDLESSGLAPGIYYLTVGAESSGTGVISSSVLAVTVSQGSGSSWLTTALVLCSATAGLAGAVLWLRSAREKRRI